MLKEADFLVPVPLHYSRLIKRRFNQSALLARRLVVRKNPAHKFKLDTDILRRGRATPSQGSVTLKGRFKNVKGAFHVPAKAKARIKGAHIILIDDVFTTGATLEACARCLKRGGAGRGFNTCTGCQSATNPYIERELCKGSAMPKVEMYTKAFCPYCVRAKSIFKKRKIDVIDIPAAFDRAKRAEMQSRSGGRNTFPQIFIDGKHIGGCDDLMALDRRGGLDPLLSA